MENNNDIYGRIFPIFDRGRGKSDIKSTAEYDKLKREAAENPEAFWGNGARCLTWNEANDRLREHMSRHKGQDRQRSGREWIIEQNARA